MFAYYILKQNIMSFQEILRKRDDISFQGILRV